VTSCLLLINILGFLAYIESFKCLQIVFISYLHKKRIEHNARRHSFYVRVERKNGKMSENYSQEGLKIHVWFRCFRLGESSCLIRSYTEKA